MSYNKEAYEKERLDWIRDHGDKIYLTEVELPKQMRPDKIKRDIK